MRQAPANEEWGGRFLCGHCQAFTLDNGRRYCYHVVFIGGRDFLPRQSSGGRTMNAILKSHQPATDELAQANRQKAIDFARASVGLEGFTLSPEVEAINRRFIAGELTGDEHVAAIRAAVLRG